MSAALATISAITALVPSVDPVPYSPALLLTDLTTGVATVLPWVGAGVGGAVVLMFAFMGIRKGFQFFRGIAK